MAIALPFAVDTRLAGTCFVAGLRERRIVVATALHLVGSGTEFAIGLPPHGGDISLAQRYPIDQVQAIKVELALADPILDIALLTTELGDDAQVPPVPAFISSPSEIAVGEEVFVVGYPWAILGSFLETAHLCHVSAKGRRSTAGVGARDEVVLSVHAHPGSSGSPVVRRRDGKIAAVLRGSLAPPSMVSVGNIPIGTDSTVTFATVAHQLPALISSVLKAYP